MSMPRRGGHRRELAVLIAVLSVAGILLSQDRVRLHLRPPAREALPEGRIDRPHRGGEVFGRTCTALKVLTPEGEPLAGLPVSLGDGSVSIHMDASGLAAERTDDMRVGVTDARGTLCLDPGWLPGTFTVLPWPSLPPAIDVPDDGRQHELVVHDRCNVDITLEAPPASDLLPARIEVRMGGWISHLQIEQRRTRLVVPCGIAQLNPETSWGAPTAFRPDPDMIDTRSGDILVRLVPVEAVRVYVTDAEARPMPDAQLLFGWRTADEDGYWNVPVNRPIFVTAPGYLPVERWPDQINRWARDAYTVALTPGRKVPLLCERKAELGECAGKVNATCGAAGIEGRGECTPRAPRVCDCPAGPGAEVLVLGPDWEGTAAPVEDDIAVLRKKGTATIVSVADEFACETVITKRAGDGKLHGLAAGKCESDSTAWSALAAGEYWLQNRSSGWRGPIRVAPGETREVGPASEAENSASVRIELHDSDGGSIPNGSGWIKHSSGWEHFKLELPGRLAVAPGSALVVATASGACAFAWEDIASGVALCTVDPDLTIPFSP